MISDRLEASTPETNAENKDESSTSGSWPARYIQNTEQYIQYEVQYLV